MTESVGFIGIGTMGAPMAASLQRAGYRLVVSDVLREAAEALLAGGATWAEDVAALRREADVVVTMLPGPAEIEQVAFGPKGLVEAFAGGGLWIDMSSNSVELARRLAEACQQTGTRFVDAPVTGGAARARDASLTIMAGGDEAAFQRAKPLLDAMGAKVVHTGAAGTGCALKLILNFLSTTTAALVSEALTLGRSSGLSLETLMSVFEGGFGDSVVLQSIVACAKGPRRFEFAASLARKDVSLADQLATDLGLPSRFAGVTVGLLDEVLADSALLDDVFSLAAAAEGRAAVKIA